jgi:PncC family amidohydrolase
MSQALHTLLCERKKTLSLAESITGGALGLNIVKNPGCSLYFLGSIVAYSKEAKMELLNVSEKTLKNFGEVSEETALEMSLGVLKKFHSDFALATTGIAGPSGATFDKPIGMVSFCIASKDKDPLYWTSFFQGQRDNIIEQAVSTAMLRLVDYVR